MSKLNWFYSLELNQVDLYIAQSKAFKDSYESIIFERAAAVEQGHVENIGKIIKEFGGKPTIIGGLVSPVIGRIAGKLTACSGVANTLKANILIERKAMKDYTDLINDIRNEYGEALETMLKHNLADEDMHTAWFSERLSDYDSINLRE